MITKTHLAQGHSAPVEVDIGPVWNPGTSWSRLSENTLHNTFLDFVDRVSQNNQPWSKQRKKSGVQPLVETTKQGVLESTKTRHLAPMDKFGTAMRSRYEIFRKTIQESLDAESSDGNHSWPGDATSSDSWRFCIAWFSNCYGNEHHRMQNRAILLQCDRPLRSIKRRAAPAARSTGRRPPRDRGWDMTFETEGRDRRGL